MNSTISIRKTSIFSGALLALGLTGFAQGPNDTVWTNIWNGNNLSDWDIKFAGSALNVNLNNTIRAVGGVMEVNFTGWTNFTNQYGHIGYKVRSYSFYFVRVEYQHWGTQLAGSPTWALENNGLILHSQSMASMGLNQDFALGMEFQLLGSGNTVADPNSTLNVCTPGTAFYTVPTGGVRNNALCYSAANNVRPATGVWAWASALVMGDSIIRHYNGPMATGTPDLTYYRPVQAVNSGVTGATIPIVDNAPLTQGYIAVQAEGAPYRFRVLDVMDLVGCMTPGNANYKTYFVRHDPLACGVTRIHGRENPLSSPMTFDPIEKKLRLNFDEDYSIRIFSLSGKAVLERKGRGNNTYDLSSIQPRGLHFLTLARGAKADTQKLMLDR